MVPQCHKQALWKERGHLFNHRIPEESQRDTQFVPLLLSHKFNCFTWTQRKGPTQKLETTRGSRWIYVRVCLRSELGVLWVCVCVVLQMNSHNSYPLVSVYLQTWRVIDSGKHLGGNTEIKMLLFYSFRSLPGYINVWVLHLFNLPSQTKGFHKTVGLKALQFSCNFIFVSTWKTSSALQRHDLIDIYYLHKHEHHRLKVHPASVEEFYRLGQKKNDLVLGRL